MPVNSIIQGVLFFCLLGIAAIVDIKKREIPDAVCLGVGLLIFLDFHAVNILGIFVAIPFYISAVWKPIGMGGGDIKLTAASGLLLGFSRTTIGVILGLSAVILFHWVMNIIWSKKDKKAKPKAYPLAPFLAFGFICAFFF